MEHETLDLIPAQRLSHRAYFVKGQADIAPAGEIEFDAREEVVHSLAVGVFGGDDNPDWRARGFNGVQVEGESVVLGPVMGKLGYVDGFGGCQLPAQRARALADEFVAGGDTSPGGGVITIADGQRGELGAGGRNRDEQHEQARYDGESEGERHGVTPGVGLWRELLPRKGLSSR